MLFEGCQGRKGPEIKEIVCPDCGETIEMTADDLFAECENCGTQVINDRFSCAFRCAEARKCIGEAAYMRMMKDRARWEAQLRAQMDDDEW